MSTENLLQLLLRLLPALIVLALGFIAAADKKTRRRWSDLLYQVGSVRSDQRDDPKVQSGVRWPFFVVAFLMLIWPIQFYRHATRVFATSPNAYGVSGKGQTQFDPYGAGNTAPAAVNNAPVPPPPPGAPAPPAAPAAVPTFSPYGQR